MLHLMPCDADIWTRCPGSAFYLMREKIEDEFYLGAKNTAKRYGAIAHIVAANALRGYEPNYFSGVKCARFIPKEVKQSYISDAKWYKNKILELTTPDMLGKGIEATVRLESIIHEPHAKGKIDYFTYNADHLMIFDYKHGEKPVEVKNNRQLWLYAAGLLDTKTFWKGSKVTVAIIQPAFRSVKTQTFSADYVRGLARRYEQKADAALNMLKLSPEQAIYKPLHSTCSYCLGAGRCPATKG